MAQTDRFYIGQIDGSGMQTNLRPYAIPDNAFAQLTNAYVFRGRVRKRFGSRLMHGTAVPTSGYEQLTSRFRINIGTTDGAGAFNGFVPRTGLVPNATPAIGQMFSIGNQIFTVNALGAPANLLFTGAIATATYDTSSGAANSGQVIFAGAALLTDVYFYPALPVMGLISYESVTTNINNELIYGFDTRFAYQFTTTGWSRLGTALWTGDNADFFWGANWHGLTADVNYLYVSNYNFGTNLNDSDVMKYWDGAAWNNFNPVFSSTVATSTIVTARIVLPYKNRLVLLNVVENTGVAPGTNAVYVNRCRYSKLGSPVDANSFYSIAGLGGFEDAPTKEAIVTAQFLKDRLIVYFESSTWELVYTGNENRPFVWQQINTELGAESTFSQVAFDKIVLGVGNVGIHACNGTNVDRIDDKIPDSVFQIHNADNGIARVYGIRDYYVEMVYWTFPDVTRDSSQPFNNRVLIYNYKTGSWAFNQDSITAFGYNITSASQGETWQQDIGTWATDQTTWQDGPNVQAQFKSVIAGNQEGYVFFIDPDNNRNAPALQITDMVFDGFNTITITAVNHNLRPGFNAEGDYILIENVQGMNGVNGNIYAVNAIIDADTFTVIALNIMDTYEGGGTIARVSNINIITKQYNFYANQGRNASINKVDFLVDRTSNGEITVDYALSSSGESQLFFGGVSGALVGTGVLETSPYALIPLEQSQDRLWHPIYPMATGECIQFNLYMDEGQLIDPDISLSDFQLHAFCIYAQSSSRLQ